MTDKTFPFTTVRVLGVILVVFAFIVFVMGIVALALNVSTTNSSYELMVFGAISMSITACLVSKGTIENWLVDEPMII